MILGIKWSLKTRNSVRLRRRTSGWTRRERKNGAIANTGDGCCCYSFIFCVCWNADVPNLPIGMATNGKDERAHTVQSCGQQNLCGQASGISQQTSR